MSVITKPGQRLRAEPRLVKRETAVGHVVGLSLALCGGGMLVSALVEWIQGGPNGVIFVVSGLLAGLPGFALWNRTRAPERIPAAAIFAAVLFGWIAFCVAATIPYLASDTFLRFDLALFEAVSGFTTTAATVLRSVEDASPGLLFWRATTQWIGGIAVVIFAVSVLPFLGVGGMELVRSATAGPASERLGGRVRTTAARLVPLYVFFTVLVAIAYIGFGMSVFEGVVHAFTTVSTGGFSTRSAGLASFRSAGIEWVAIVAMIVAGGSYALYWRALRGKPLVLFRSFEFRAYLLLTALFCAAAIAWNEGGGELRADLVRRTIFTTVSLTSTTGYRMLDLGRYAAPAQLLFVFAMGLGGMAGSAAGGFKVFRLLAVVGYARRQLFTQLHPRAVNVVRLGRDIVPDIVVTRIVGFFGVFMAAGGAATLLVAAFGADVLTAISSVASSIGNVGPVVTGSGAMLHYADFDAATRGILMVVMLVGRLDVFPVLLGLVPFARFVSDRLPGAGSRRFVRLLRG
jgi:trk system potassium uptake protein TrkH